MRGHIRRRGERSWELKYDVGTDPRTGRRVTKAALHVGPATRERYVGLLALHVRPHIGASSLHRLQPVHLAELYAKLLEKGVSAGTIKDVHQV